MLIPSIDLQDGRVVQLVQGEKLAIASDDLDGWIAKLPADAKPDVLIREAYLRCVSRAPTAAETKRCLDYFAETADRKEALSDVVWALLNTQEFVTNH